MNQQFLNYWFKTSIKKFITFKENYFMKLKLSWVDENNHICTHTQKGQTHYCKKVNYKVTLNALLYALWLTSLH